MLSTSFFNVLKNHDFQRSIRFTKLSNFLHLTEIRININLCRKQRLQNYGTKKHNRTKKKPKHHTF